MRRSPPPLAQRRPLALLALAVALRAGASLAGESGGAPPAPAGSAALPLERRLALEAPAGLVRALRVQALAAREPGPWVDLAQAHRYRCDLEAMRAALEHALARDPLHAQARAGLAEALLLEGEADRALAQADLGLAAPGGEDSAALWRVRCLTLVELRRYPEAQEAGGRALALDPFDARAAEALGRAAFQAGDMDASREAYAAAAALEPYAEEAALRLGNGFGLATEGRPWEQGEEGAAFHAAASALQAGLHDEARDRFAALVRRAPGTFKHRLGLGAALAARRRAHEARAGLPAATLYALLPAPTVPGLERVLPDLPRLSAREQHVVRVCSAPLGPWWPALIAAGARHDLLPLAENLGDRAARADLRERLTFDGRRYDHLRGVGGLVAATGVEKLAEAADLAYHTFAHELAHQVLAHALPPALVERVKVLYARAVIEARCLDYYAASNADEYFAQGFEAFVSHVKRGCLKETQRHVRAELLARDPALHALFVEILDLSHETPEALSAFRAAWGSVAPPPAPEGR